MYASCWISVSLCIVNDCMVHVTSIFYVFQKVVSLYIKTLDSNMRERSYFSDGTVSQCKGRIKCQFIRTVLGLLRIFAISNGKGCCDAVWSTTKLQAARESLQHPYDKQLLTKDFYEFCTREHLCNKIILGEWGKHHRKWNRAKGTFQQYVQIQNTG